MTFIDGLFVASSIWIFIACLCLFLGVVYGMDIDRDALSEYWDSAIKTGFTIAYFYANDPDVLEKLTDTHLNPDFLEMLKENENEEHNEGNPYC